jgi:hypothetical protein
MENKKPVIIESGLRSVEFKVKTSSGLKVFEWSYNPGDPAIIEAYLKAHGIEKTEYDLETLTGRESLSADIEVVKGCVNDIFDDPSVFKSIFRHDNPKREFLQAVFDEVTLGIKEFREAEEAGLKAEKRAQAKAESANYRANKT